MPTLNWIGKKAVENHHREVPFHLLKDAPDLSVGDPGKGNLVIEYKNTKDWDLPDNQGKRQLGELWEKRSKGKCLFIMPCGKDWDAIKKKTSANR